MDVGIDALSDSVTHTQDSGRVIQPVTVNIMGGGPHQIDVNFGFGSFMEHATKDTTTSAGEEITNLHLPQQIWSAPNIKESPNKKNLRVFTHI